MLALAAALLISASPESHAQAPLGAKPTYTSRELTPVPNARAVQRRIWIPALDEGFVPQGIVFLDGRLFISGYFSIDRKQDRGPCRLIALDAKTGAALGHLDLPASCGHAGGLARGSPGRLIVTDARVLFEIELMVRAGDPIGRVVSRVKLDPPVKGSFVASEESGVWIGQYERAEPARMFRFPWAALGKKTLAEADAVETVSIPALAQGAAFDASGALWIMRSGSTLGEIVKLDRASGASLARFAMPAGGEGISFEPDGALWTLSEAGSRRWSHWKAFYPLALRFEMPLLQ